MNGRVGRPDETLCCIISKLAILILSVSSVV